MGSGPGDMTRGELIGYLTAYQKAAKKHSEAIARTAQLQRQIQLVRQGLSALPKKPGRPPKHPQKPSSPSGPSLPTLERQLAAAQRRAEEAWKAYQQLDDMGILPGRSARQCSALLHILTSRQADTLPEALALLERRDPH